MPSDDQGVCPECGASTGGRPFCAECGRGLSPPDSNPDPLEGFSGEAAQAVEDGWRINWDRLLWLRVWAIGLLAYFIGGVAADGNAGFGLIVALVAVFISLLGPYSPATCPYCGKAVKMNAESCHHCGRVVA